MAGNRRANIMKILFQHIFYRPEPIGNGTYTGEMCEWLAQQGHTVTVVCPPPYYPQWSVQPPYKQWRYSTEEIGGVTVHRCPIWLPAISGGIQRILHELSFMVLSLPAALLALRHKPDVVFVIEPSLMNGISALLVGRCCGAVCWLHVQDFEIDIAISLNQLGKGLLRSWALRFERFLMQQFDVVSTISDRMLEKVAAKGVAPERQLLFPNWVDTTKTRPSGAEGSLRKELGIPDDRIVVLFSGTLGAKQATGLLVEAARLLIKQTAIEIIICGDGAAVPGLREQASGLTNVRFLPLQPLDRLNALLNTADIHALTQKPEVADLVMPSKLLGMLATGKPIVATALPDTEVAKAISACGILVEPENAIALAAAISKLADDHEHRYRLGKAAREYAVTNLDKDRVLREFEMSLQRIRGTAVAAKAASTV